MPVVESCQETVARLLKQLEENLLRHQFNDAEQFIVKQTLERAYMRGQLNPLKS